MVYRVRLPGAPFQNIYKIKNTKSIMVKKEVKKVNESLGVSGFTLSVSGFLTILFSPILSFIFFIAAIIFCAVQQKKKKTKLAKLGITLGIIGTILSIIYTIILIVYVYSQLSTGGLI